ncbi:nucleolar protein 5, putative [Plasmodium ovale]|uniref:Nucleolar protein 5, putative n=2 Tax=Plasmodium ovale TaxID=36330 RepID=A0A1D3JFI9_PLAOA|nr:nucleolar protein 5, putative (NOP5) [Plasmodium ovale curtisi]SBS99734.1 nucleolar protein 5, putative (NOP5) [Plasmodium ovale curtisi]SBT84707.1 nucleolar protein 5, putative [Plasmodium ovale]
MLVLVETAAGYGLFKVENDKLIESDAKDIAKCFANAEEARKNVSLYSFSKFKKFQNAFDEVNKLMDSKLGKGLKKFIKKNIVKPKLNETLALCDKTLGGLIKKKYNINVTYTNSTQEIIRGIRTHLYGLLVGVKEEDSKLLKLSLSHSLNRFKLKFSADKVDVMIIQAVGLLEDLDKEINVFSMRLKEWYGWHFPELGKVISDNKIYAKCVKLIGFRNNAKNVNLLEETTEEMQKEIKQLAEISMGTDIEQDDLDCINELADRLLELTEYRESLSTYLKYRMNSIAPNLTYLVGDLIGAKLIAKAGSLMSLAKHPSSTLQILGSEKALFRALKTRSKTPKYGLIYHATLVGQAAPKIKGRISRSLAAKLSLCSRVDALGNFVEPSIAINSKIELERRLESITNTIQSKKGNANNAKVQSQAYQGKYNPNQQNGNQNGDNSVYKGGYNGGNNNNKQFNKKRDFRFNREADKNNKKFIKKQKRK